MCTLFHDDLSDLISIHYHLIFVGSSYIGSREQFYVRVRWQRFIILVHLSHMRMETPSNGSTDPRFVAQRMGGIIEHRQASHLLYWKERLLQYDWNSATKKQRDNSTTKKGIITALMTTEYVSLEKVHLQKLRPQAALSVFVQEIQKNFAGLIHARTGTRCTQ